MCGRRRPNERFGGRGERAIICRECRKMPREERRRCLLSYEVLGFLDQSNISTKNIGRLAQIEAEATDDVAALASLVRRIAQVRPRKRKRWRLFRRQHPDLFHLAVEAGLLLDLEPEQLGGDADPFAEEDWFDRWIEPELWELEPTDEELRAASDDSSPRLKTEPQELSLQTSGELLLP